MQKQMAGRALTGLALLILAVRVVANLILDPGVKSWVFDLAGIAFFAGVLLWLSGASEARRHAKSALLFVDPSKDVRQAHAVVSAFSELPPLIDCRDAAVAAAYAARASHPLLRELLVVLGEWHPRRAGLEKAYQRSLCKKLDQCVPAAEPMLEFPLPARGAHSPGRIDILLGNCVLIEMKRSLNTSTAQKALGQVQMYAGLWRDRGPVVLVMCDTDAAFAASFFERPIHDLRSAGHSVVAVLAGV